MDCIPASLIVYFIPRTPDMNQMLQHHAGEQQRSCHTKGQTKKIRYGPFKIFDLTRAEENTSS